MRAFAVVVHRWVGLVMAGFLLLTGLTGCLLAWFHELDSALNPRLMQVVPPAAAHGAVAAPLLDPLVLRERVRAAYPQAAVNHVSFHQAAPGDARVFYVEVPEAAAGPNIDEAFVNPYTGEVLGDRKWGDITQGITNLMPFVYRLHYALALDAVGTWILGIVALLWTVDCFIGAWLTFPASRQRGGGLRQWWTRWQPAWAVRWRGGRHKLNFDLHRAGGLWPWAMLFVLAWSSVAFNLSAAVYRPVMGLVFELQTDPREALPTLATPSAEPAMGWDAALAASRRQAAAQASAQGFTVLAEDRISYDPRKGYLRYVVRTDRDVNERRGQTALFIDAATGRLLGTVLPTGKASGDTVTTWLTTLHMGHLWGMPFQVFLSTMGLAVASLSVTGVLIWWKKRAARAARRAVQAPSPAGTVLQKTQME